MLRGALPLQHIARPAKQKGSGAPPLLLMLHRVGSNERDLFTLADQLDPRFHILSLQGPLALGPDQYGWSEVQFTPTGPELNPGQLERSRQKLVDFIKQAPEHYGSDPARIFLLGFSQGGTLCLTTLLTAPDGLAGIVAVAGRIPRELFLADSALGGKLVEAEDLEGLPIFLGHGLQDEVVPINFGEQAERILSRSPVKMTYREYDMGHEIGRQCLMELDLWLRTQLGDAR